MSSYERSLLKLAKAIKKSNPQLRLSDADALRGVELYVQEIAKAIAKGSMLATVILRREGGDVEIDMSSIEIADMNTLIQKAIPRSRRKR